MNIAQYCDFATVYDRLMNDVDYDKWAEYLSGLIQSYGNGGKRITECACGTGNITIRLKRMCYDVVGCDISEEMLEVAANKTRDNGLMIPYAHMDMRKLKLHRPADCIIAACDGANYLTGDEDLFAFLNSAYNNLKAGGLLLFDISSEYKLEKVLGMNTFGERDELCSYIWQNIYDDKSRLLEMNLSFFVKEGDLYRRFDETHIQMAHGESDVLSMLEKAGFKQALAFNAFTTHKTKDCSERIQFVAVK